MSERRPDQPGDPDGLPRARNDPRALDSLDAAARLGRPTGSWRARAYTVVFEADTRAGRLFDLLLVASILASVAIVMLDSVESISAGHGRLFDVVEWAFTLLFTAEYLLRLACVRHPLRYATSLFGIVDLLAVLPTYLAFFMPEAHALIDVRMLRLLRVFRLLKLGAYVSEFGFLAAAIRASRRKIVVFISFVLITVVVMGTVMYVVEGPGNGFTSIPMAVYWGITTMTTVGFGDITPKTDLGRFIASCMMLMGWGVLAVPTGIVTAEMTVRRSVPPVTTRTCPDCLTEGHDPDALFCKHCGAALPEYRSD